MCTVGLPSAVLHGHIQPALSEPWPVWGLVVSVAGPCADSEQLGWTELAAGLRLGARAGGPRLVCDLWQCSALLTSDKTRVSPARPWERWEGCSVTPEEPSCGLPQNPGSLWSS